MTNLSDFLWPTRRHWDQCWNSFHVGERERERERERVSTRSTSFFTFVISCLSHFSTRRVQSHVHLSMIQNLFMKRHLTPPSSSFTTRLCTLNSTDKYNQWEKSVGQCCCCWLQFPVIVRPTRGVRYHVVLNWQARDTALQTLYSAQLNNRGPTPPPLLFTILPFHYHQIWEV